MDDNSADDRDLFLLIAAAAAQPKEAASEVVERNGKEENGTPPPRMRVSQQEEDRHEVLLVPEDAPAGVKSFVSSAAPIAPMSRSVAVPQEHKVHQEDRDERELRPPSRAETEAMCRRSVPSKMSLHDFEKLGLLGMGGAAIVYLVRHRASRVVYAMKVQHISSSNPADRQTQRAFKEQQILQTLEHPFVARLHFAFEDGDKLCLVMEFYEGGSLKDLQDSCGSTLTEQDARFYAAEVVLALEYVHTMGFVYRDLKLQNILLSKDGHIRLADFGVAQLGEHIGGVYDSKRGSKRPQNQCGVDERVRLRSNSFVGTMDYMPPEMIQQKAHHSTDLDWWTLGCSLYELLYGVPPFRNTQDTAENQDDPAALFKEILRCRVSFPATPKVSDACKNLMRRLLAKDPDTRLGHKFGAGEIKQHPFFEGVQWALLGHAQPPVVVSSAGSSCLQRFCPKNILEEVLQDLVDFEERLGITTTDSDAAENWSWTSSISQRGHRGTCVHDDGSSILLSVSTPSSISSVDTFDGEFDQLLEESGWCSCGSARQGCLGNVYMRNVTSATMDRSRSFADVLLLLRGASRQSSSTTKEVASLVVVPSSSNPSNRSNSNSAVSERSNAWTAFADRATTFLSERRSFLSRA